MIHYQTSEDDDKKEQKSGSDQMKQKILVLLAVLCLVFLTIGCTDKNSVNVPESAKPSPVSESITIKTAPDQENVIAKSSAGVSEGKSGESLSSILDIVNGSWRVYYTPGQYSARILVSDLKDVPDIELSTVSGKKIAWAKGFQLSDIRIDGVNKQYRDLVPRELGGFSSLGIGYGDKLHADTENFAFSNTQWNKVPTVIYQTNLTEKEIANGEFIEVKILGIS